MTSKCRRNVDKPPWGSTREKRRLMSMFAVDCVLIGSACDMPTKLRASGGRKKGLAEVRSGGRFPDFGPKLVELGPELVVSGPTVAALGPILVADVGPKVVKCPGDCGRDESNSANLPNSGRSQAKFADLGRFAPEFGHMWPGLDRIRLWFQPHFGQIWPGFGQLRTDFLRNSPLEFWRGRRSVVQI